ncbi:hypothetical protein VTK73DRAFT_3028 [Phialemonium thermophilum]|uniref:Uncharacterized protein n=1 Tax=Phialemonium thermophilum TaxID=223376 RepID=A0ABR3X161_9PEZI
MAAWLAQCLHRNQTQKSDAATNATSRAEAKTKMRHFCAVNLNRPDFVVIERMCTCAGGWPVIGIAMVAQVQDVEELEAYLICVVF